MIKRLQDYYNQFHRTIWILLVGTILSRGAAFMTLPFLSIYLVNQDYPSFLIGLIIGMGPLMSTIGGFIGGHLSDQFGRKPIMLVALIGTAAAYFGFALSASALAFLLLNALLGLCNSFFEPTAQALMADLTKKEQRMKVFSLRYVAINIGAAVGPLIGVVLALTNASLTFYITGGIYLAYMFILLFTIQRVPRLENKENVTLPVAFHIVRRDRSLLYYILGGILLAIGYSQMDSNLPQHFDNRLENGVVIYSFLLSINAILVIILQLPFAKLMEKVRPLKSMIIGSALVAIGLFFFAISTHWIMAVIGVILFTFGEILSFPASSILIDQLASEELRGTYFGAAQFRNTGSFIGPMIGGYLIGISGGTIAFFVIAVICLCSIIFFSAGIKKEVIVTVEKKLS
ncbi:MFS transporter [Cytobacillus kochii]|uniref:MDR family MFS transporter n=1 Tax=Cytobacillus kochii TaxID=859143 RepID=UPI001CD1FD0C|nr:MFS transporter [Cytobacillus kochii]MCA1027274.1 MFS transporter [Cytobacillus kochii]